MACILAVEDEADLLDLLKEELEAEGHEVVTACDGHKALDKLASFVPDIVISDVSMPNMDGFALLENLRASYPALADTPFLFLTALADREDELRAREMGVDDYLTKPIDFDMLHSVLATRLRQVARMKDRKEQQMLKLYTALSPDTIQLVTAPQAERSCAAPATGIEDDESEPAEVNKIPGKRVFGSLFRFPNLASLSHKPPAAGKTATASVYARALEVLKRMVCEEAYVSGTRDGEIVVTYRQASESQARAMSRQLSTDFQSELLQDQREGLKQDYELTDEIIERALIVSESLFEIKLTRDELETQESFEKSVREIIEKTRNHPRAPNLLVSSIRKDDGHLAQLKLITRNNEPLPICFFNYDESSKQKLRASFTFFGKNNREKASYLVDALTLDLMGYASRWVGPRDIAVVDVHFETLASAIYATSYIRKFLHYTENTAYAFMLNIRATPKGMTPARLEEILRPLGKYAARRSIQVSPAEIAAFAEIEMPVACLVCSYSELVSSPAARDSIPRARQQLTRSGRLLVLRGIPDAGMIGDFKPLGFDGYAIDLNGND